MNIPVQGGPPPNGFPAGFGIPPNLGNIFQNLSNIRLPGQPENNARINIQVGGNIGGQRMNTDQITANIRNLIGSPVTQ